MRSPTQRTLTPADVGAVVRTGLGCPVTTAAELSGGTFAAIWRATLADGREVVVKVGPPASAGLLRYEQALIPSEAEYYTMVRRHAPGVPVPEVLAVSADAEWIITTLLPGRPLTEADSARARTELGAAIARVHEITGPHFGYTAGRPAGDDWPTAFFAIIEALRADAADWNVPLPPMDGVMERHAGRLAAVTRPALLHFDLWDGNVLATDGALTGLVDGERYLYGDPLLDFVSPALFRRIEEEPENPFAHGYFGGPPAFDRSATTRLGLYRLHLYLLMTVEMPSRGMTGPQSRGRYDLVRTLLTEEITRLGT
jgi:aminoglycoside phosphotransferase (APT) family kinase protein